MQLERALKFVKFTESYWLYKHHIEFEKIFKFFEPNRLKMTFYKVQSEN